MYYIRIMIRAVAYLRISTGHQLDGVSIDAQKSAVVAYVASQHGISLVDVIVDAGVSAGIPLHKREGGKQLLNMINSKKVDVVIATKLDRLFRSTANCLTTIDGWNKKNISLVLLDMGGAVMDTSSPMGRLFLTMMSGVAECEKALIGTRTKEALDHKRQQGQRISKDPPLGFKFQDGMVVEDPQEQAVLHKVRSLRDAGYSWGRIANGLNQKGTKARGKKWYAQTLQRALA